MVLAPLLPVSYHSIIMPLLHENIQLEGMLCRFLLVNANVLIHVSGLK